MAIIPCGSTWVARWGQPQLLLRSPVTSKLSTSSHRWVLGYFLFALSYQFDNFALSIPFFPTWSCSLNFGILGKCEDDWQKYDLAIPSNGMYLKLYPKQSMVFWVSISNSYFRFLYTYIQGIDNNRCDCMQNNIFHELLV